jgi:hypothetical protein
MNRRIDRFATRFIGLAMAAIITLAMLVGVTHIAQYEDAGSGIGLMAQAKSASAPRS